MDEPKKDAVKLAISVAVMVFLTEFLVMLLLDAWEVDSTALDALIDATFLTLLLGPVFYLLVFRPLKREIRERRAAETELRDALEQQRLLNRQLSTVRDQLVESEKLVSMGQLAAGVAHEINNPVGFIGSNLTSLGNYIRDLLGLLEVYESGHAQLRGDEALFLRLTRARDAADIGYLKEDITDLIHESQEGIERVKRIVQDLKDFSRSDDGVREAVDLNRELERTLNIAHNELKYHTQVRTHLADLPPVECVPSQINQVLLNILVNAGQAIAEKGTIDIRSRALAQEVCISITDSGSGMTGEQLERLFEPFYTTKPRGKGTGLGLSVSWGIVQKHGGRIEVESQIGQGSTFHVYLPLQAVEPDAPPVAAAHAHA